MRGVARARVLSPCDLASYGAILLARDPMTIGVSTTDFPMMVALLGGWSMLRGPDLRLEAGPAIITRCPGEPKLLKEISLQLSPSWLVLGEGLEDERLSSLASVVQQVTPKVRLAVLGTEHDPDRYERWLARGANAYLRSTMQPAQAMRSLILAHEVGLVVVDESFPRQRLARQAHLRLNLIYAHSPLTRREGEVLRFVRLGLRNSQIGTALKLTESTIEFHVSNILSKLEAENRTEAAERANLLGL